jgi:hypothetical protein
MASPDRCETPRKIEDVDDLEDTLDVMETIVE